MSESSREIAAATASAATIRSVVCAAVLAAEKTDGARLLSLPIVLGSCDPLAFFERSAGGDRFYWCQAASEVALSSRGAVAITETEGADCFEDADRAIVEAFARLHLPIGAPPDRGPVFVGGFAFSPREPTGDEWQAFPPARFLLPEMLVRRDAQGGSGVISRCILPGASVDEECQALEKAVGEITQLASAQGGCTPEVCPKPGSTADSWGTGAEFSVIADRPHAVYRGQVAEALRAIDGGGLEKVVLARALDVSHPGRFDVAAFLGSLARVYPHCTVLAVGCGDDTLVAATPELLIRREGERIETCAVAGTAPRGRSPEEDDALGRALLDSDKERAEHAGVVAAIRAALWGPCGRLLGPDAPELMRVEGIQHLATKLSGVFREGIPAPSVVELAGRLHPTPAVGGLPDLLAQDWIATHEGLDRGWYAAPVGYVDASGSGEFQVALRSALIHNVPLGASGSVSRARLFAGAGIVAGSDPEQELRETRLKLRALLAPLTEI